MPDLTPKTVLVVAGPTAVGKTALCVRLAKRLQTDVVSADSRQLYQELTIGTAKPDLAGMAGVHHHFISSHSITQPINAGQYEREALTVLNGLFREKDVVILSGGTGLYLNAVCFGLDDIPAVDPALRAALNIRLTTEGLPALVTELRRLDPVYAQTADLNNPVRVTRALEICLTTGQPFSSFHRRAAAQRPFRVVLAALDRPRADLYARIDARMDAMLTAGLVEEARLLLPWRQQTALQTVGYQEVFGYFDRQYDYDEMVRLLKRNSRRYAKRQLTWFRNQNDYHWFDADDEEGVIKFWEERREEAE